MNFDLKDRAVVYLKHTKTAVLTVAAILYVAGEEAGKFYYANQEEIHADLAAFWAAVVLGTQRAYAGTYQLGADARRGCEDHLVPFLATGLARHHRTFEALQQRLYARFAR